MFFYIPILAHSVSHKRPLCNFHIVVFPLKTKKGKDTREDMVSSNLISSGINCSVWNNHRICDNHWNFQQQDSDIEHKFPQY